MSQQVNFSVNLAIGGTLGSRLIVREPCPHDGKITEVKIHWPAGCAGLVQVAVYLGPKQICPYKGFLNLNDITPSYFFNPGIPCKQKDSIRVDLWNGDGANTHRCTVTVTVEGGE